MKVKTFENPLAANPAFRVVSARVPTRDDVTGIKVGDLAPDCFGKLSRVTRISYSGEDKSGLAFVGYFTAMSDKDTPENGCGCSNSIKEGRLIRTVALTGLFNSSELDDIEARMA